MFLAKHEIYDDLKKKILKKVENGIHSKFISAYQNRATEQSTKWFMISCYIDFNEVSVLRIVT